jgi:hypothetical protein
LQPFSVQKESKQPEPNESNKLVAKEKPKELETSRDQKPALKSESVVKSEVKTEVKPDLLSRYDTLKTTAQELMKRQSHSKADVDVMVRVCLLFVRIIESLDSKNCQA